MIISVHCRSYKCQIETTSWMKWYKPISKLEESTRRSYNELQFLIITVYRQRVREIISNYLVNVTCLFSRCIWCGGIWWCPGMPWCPPICCGGCPDIGWWCMFGWCIIFTKHYKQTFNNFLTPAASYSLFTKTGPDHPTLTGNLSRVQIYSPAIRST